MTAHQVVHVLPLLVFPASTASDAVSIAISTGTMIWPDLVPSTDSRHGRERLKVEQVRWSTGDANEMRRDLSGLGRAVGEWVEMTMIHGRIWHANRRTTRLVEAERGC